MNTDRRGFTLAEMIVVVAILAVLAALVIVAVNPSRQFGAGRNIQRQTDLEKIQGAINQYSIVNNGALPGAVSSTLQMIGTATSSCNVACTGASSTAASCANLNSLSPTYVTAIPFDTLVGSSARTYYAVKKTGTYGLLIRACSPELGKTLEIIQ